jgi:hypothetical protein
MSIYIDTLKDGDQIYGTDNLATELAKNSQTAIALEKDAKRVADADKAINALFQFCTDCGYIMKLDRTLSVNDDGKLSFAILLKIFDSDNLETYGFTFMASIYEAGFNGDLKIKIRDMYDHIVEAKSNSRGYTSSSRKHPLSFLGTKFKASKACANEYYWTIDNFVENVPALTKYFKKSNTLGKYRAKNEEIVNGAAKSKRKMEIQKTKINGFVDEFETFVESIDPSLHVFVKEESSSDVKSAIWYTSIFNSNLALWSARYYWTRVSSRQDLEQIFSDKEVYAGTIPFYLNKKPLDDAREKILGWLADVEDCNLKAEYTKILEDEYKKPMPTIDGIYNLNEDYIVNHVYNGGYNSMTHNRSVALSFRIIYFADSDSWQINYDNLSLFPAPFKEFLEKANRTCKNPVDLIKYVELVYKVSQKANDYANKVIALTKAAEEDLKA